MAEHAGKKPATGTLMVGAIALVVAGLLGWKALHTAGPAAPQESLHASPTPVTAMKITPRDLPLVWDFIGKTRSVSKVEIRARVDGFLEKRLYEEGTKVTQGQPLFLIDQKPFLAKLESSRAALQAQEAALQYAKVNLDRVESMVGNNVTAKKDLDSATSSYKTSLAAVEMAKAQVRQDELELGYTSISSPIAGLTSFAQQEVGAYINNTDKSLLTYVAQLDPMRVEFSVSENQLLKVRDDAQRGRIKDTTGKSVVELVLIDGSVYPYRGEITFADASLSETTGTFLIRATVPNPKEDLRPGQFVRIRLLGAVRPNAILLPQRAVMQNPTGSFVWVVGEGGKVSARPVEAGDWYQKNFWLIDEGLRGGETVVVDGAGKLAPAEQVTVERYLDEQPAVDAPGSTKGKFAPAAGAEVSGEFAPAAGQAPQAQQAVKKGAQ